MNPLRVWAVMRKEALHILRDPRSLGMGIAIPMLLLVLFGYALTLDVDDVPLVVWDQSETQVSRAPHQSVPGIALLFAARIHAQLPGTRTVC